MGGKSSKTKEKKEDRDRDSSRKERSSPEKRSSSSKKDGGKQSKSSGKGSSKSDDKLPAVRQTLGSWKTNLTNCSAMSVDPEGANIAVGGTGADMKNIIRIYDLQGNIVSECGTTDNSPVRGLTFVKKGGERRLAIIYHQPAFKPANIEIRDVRDVTKATTAYNATAKPAEEICATSGGVVMLNTDKSPKFKCITELFWTSDDSWKLKPKPDVSAPLTVTTDDKTPLGVVFGLGSLPPAKGGASGGGGGGAGGGGDLTLLCIASYSSLGGYSLQATGSGRETWTLRAGPPNYRLSDGLLRYPCDVCAFRGRACLVADQSLNNVSMFSVEGKGSFMKVLAGEKESLDKPRGLGFIQSKGTLVVLNKEGAEVRLFHVK